MEELQKNMTALTYIKRSKSLYAFANIKMLIEKDNNG